MSNNKVPIVSFDRDSQIVTSSSKIVRMVRLVGEQLFQNMMWVGQYVIEKTVVAVCHSVSVTVMKMIACWRFVQVSVSGAIPYRASARPSTARPSSERLSEVRIRIPYMYVGDNGDMGDAVRSQ